MNCSELALRSKLVVVVLFAALTQACAAQQQDRSGPALSALSLAAQSPVVSPQEAFSSLRLPLRVAESNGVARTNQPVSGGIPLPRGAYHDASVFYIEERVHAQFKPLVHWPDGSIRWLLAVFDADVPAHQEVVYHLRADGRAASKRSALSVYEDEDKVVLDTGPLKLQIAKRGGFSMFERVTLDDHEIVSPSTRSGVQLTAEFEQRAFSAVHTDSEYRVEVTESGPVRACVRARGQHGNDTYNEHAFYGYDAVICAYAGRSYVSMDFALDNRPYWEPRGPLKFSALNLDLQLNLAPDKAVSLFGETLKQGAMQEEAFIAQLDGARYVSSLGDGKRALGWLNVSDASYGVAAGIKYFWETYPNALEVTADDVLRISPFPARANETYYLQDLTRKIYKTAFYFHRGNNTEDVAAVMGGFLNHPLMASTPRLWVSDTRAVLGDLAPPEGDVKNKKRPLINDHLGGKRYREGWYRFGYSPYFNDDNAREVMHTEGIDYLSSLDREDFLALEASVHVEGLKPYHVHEKFQTLSLFRGRESAGPNDNGFSHKDYLNTPQGPRWFNHPTDPLYWGNGIVGEQRGWRGRNEKKGFAWIAQDPGHMDVRHVVDYYCLTGDLFAKDMVRSAGELRGMLNAVLAQSPKRLGDADPKISRSISATSYNLITYYFLFPEERTRRVIESLGDVYLSAAAQSGHLNQRGALDYEKLRPFYEAIATYSAVLFYELTGIEAFKRTLELNAKAYYQLIEPNGYMRFNEKSPAKGPVGDTSTSNYRVFDAVTGLMQFVPGHLELQERLALTLASWSRKITRGKRRGWFQKYKLRLAYPDEFSANPPPRLLARIADGTYARSPF